MNTSMNGEPRERNLTTADLAASANKPPSSSSGRSVMEINTDGVAQIRKKEEAKLAPLFTEDAAADFRSRWDVVQRGFVDDPQQAVHAGDELVSHGIKSLAETFANQRSALDGEVNQPDQSSTENLRLALRCYRSFFQRLLTI